MSDLDLSQLLADLSSDKRALLELLLHEEGVDLSASVIVPREWGSADAPLSFAQRRLWLTDRLEPGSSAYNMPFAFRLAGRLDLPALERAADGIVARHEVLRTTFPTAADGEPVQRVAAHVALRLPLIDLTALNPAAREGEARRLAGAEAARPFDLAAGPLLRLGVVRLAGEDHLVVANMHHIVSDGWSIGVFLREMAALYEALAAGRPSPLARLPIQYRDFASWQAEYLDSEKLEAELAYWRERLAGAPPLLELPTDRPRGAGGAGRAGSLELAVPEPVVQGLRRIAAAAGTTLFAALLAGFQEILHRWSGTDDVVVGTPSAGRDRVETEGLIGFFVQTLVLRTDLGGDPSYRELVRRCSEVVLGAQSHQDLPFERLVEELAPDRRGRHAPVFQVMFALENTPREGPRLPGLALLPAEVESPSAKFDLILTFRERAEGGLGAGLVYDRDLFAPGSMQRLAGHLERLLAGAAAEPDARVSGLPWLSAEERRQVVETWNATATPFPREATIQDLFAAQAAARPEAVALRYGDEQVSYGELARRAGQLALYLRSLGVGPESRVGVCLERSVEVVAVLLGILEAGGAYVPLDPAYPAERLRFLIEDSGVERVLTRGGLLAEIEAPCAVVRLEEVAEEIAALPPGALAPSSWADSLAYVMYTSGSTGTPKGVGVTHRNVVRLVRDTDFARMGPDEVFLLMAPLSFDATTLELWAPLLNGGTLAILEPGGPTLEALEAALLHHGVTTLWLTAGLFHLAVDERPAALRPLRQLLSGGDVLSPAHVARALRELPGLRLINGYGPTENTTFTCTHPITAADTAGSVPIGRPIANTTVYLLDDGARPVPVGVAGELYTGGSGLARGYLGRPGLTAERFVPDPFGAAGSRLYRTGDLARFLPDGRVEFLGRRDGQVKLRGIRVELGEIEAALNLAPGVRESVVVVRGEGAADKLLVAYVVPAEGTVSVSALREHLSGRLPEALVPAAFVLLPELPLTPNGKVDRRALPAPEPERDAEPAEQGARTPIEEIVAGLFAEVLDLGEVGREESFFDLGGHSLRATQIVSRLRQSLGVELPLRSLFEEPTPAGLAALVERELSAARQAAAPPLARVAGRGALPLSFAQQRLWLIDRLEPGSAAYNIPAAWRLRGPLNVAALAGSLAGIVARHEVLRTRFAIVEGGPVQIVEPAAGVPLPVVDLGALAEDGRHGELARLVRAEARRPFELERDAMLRSTLVRLGEGDHAALFTVHHIAGDGWSLGVFIRELGELYAALAAGRPVTLPELPVQYGDYAAWQRSWMSEEVLAADLSWWRERLGSLPPVLELPADHSRPPVQSYRGATVSRELTEELGASLRALARRQGATLFMVLLAGFEALLHRMTGQAAFAVGTPVAGRTRVELEPLIGFFVNTLALPARVAGEESFRGLLQRSREVALEAYARQQIPFEMLVDELHPERSLAHSPVFQVLFALQNAAPRGRGLAGLELSALAQDTGTAKFDLSLIVSEGRRLTAGLEYSSDLFEAATVRRMLGHLERLLAGAVADPDVPVSDLPWLSEDERRQILEEWNDTAAPFPREATIHGLFAAQAAARPEAVALRFGAEEVSYGELARRAGRFARYLRRLGVGLESRVGVCLERSVEVVAALLGILEAGGAYVPLDPAYPAERLRYLIADSGVAWVLTRGELLAKVEVPCRVVRLEEVAEEIAALSPWTPDGTSFAGSLAYVIYTSGSTGRPKGVGVTHRSVVRLVRDTGYARLGPDEVFLLMVPLSFDVSTLELWAPLTNGGVLAIMEPGSPTLEALEAALLRHGVTTLWLTAGLFHLAVDERPEALRSVRQLLSGGDVLSPAHVARVLRELPGVDLINGYGPTENTTFTTTHLITAADTAGSVPIGRPIANSTVYLLDRGLRPVPVGVTAELYTGGEGVARGYLGRPRLTADRFVPDPFGLPGSRMYRTGDLARYWPDGRVEFLGRIDGQVKLRGIRVELGEIEAALTTAPGVRAAAVTIRGEGAGDKRLVAYVVPAEAGEGAVSASALREHLSGRLPEALVPSAFVVVPELPLSPNGKVDRRALPEPAPEREADAAEERGARGPLEEIVAGLFAAVLGLDEVGPEESFFDLGGHSLLAMQITSRLRQSLGVELPLRSLFEEPTPAGLAGRVERELAAARLAAAPPLERVARTGPLPLSFAQQRLWLIDRLEPGSAAYNIPAGWRLRGPLNVAALAGSLTAIVARHEVLRTRFATVAGEPVQIVEPAAAVPLPVVDLAALAAERRAGELFRLAGDEARRPFDLERDLMLRALLVRLGAGDHAALFTVHHIAGDGWSLGVLIRELGELYAALAAGRPAALPELPVQYGDYAAWQRSWMSEEVLAADLSWWRERLGALPPVLELPVDHSRPPVQSYRGATVSRELPEELSASLRALARRQGATLFMVLLAGFEALLYRSTGQAAFAVGTPVAGRTRVELEPLIGFFVNTLALPARVEGEEGFRGLLGRVREVALEGYARQQIPFEMLVDELRPERSLSHSPVFQVLFALQNAAPRGRGLAGLELASLAQDTGTAKFDLSLIVSEGRRLTAVVEYASDLFEAATARRILGHLERLLAGAVADPDGPVAGLPWLSDDERRQILGEWTATGSNGPADACLHDLFAAQARRTPDSVAVVAGETVLTYAGLDARAETLARRLRALGVGPEERVGVCLARGADLIVALLAVLKAGGAYVPLDPAYPPERLELMARDSGGRVLLTQESLLPLLPAAGFLPLCLDRLPDGEPAGRTPAAISGPGNLAYVIYTSGSTGRPKGVAIEHRSAVAMVRWARGIFSDGELAGVLAATSVCFDVSVFEIFAPLSWGGRLIVVENVLALAAPMSLPPGVEVRVVSAVPSALAELIRLGSLPATVATLNLGGEPVTEALAEQIHRQETVRRVYNLYGPSEDTTYSTWSRVERGGGQPTIGRPLTGTQAYVLDPRLEPVAVGVPGELWLGGEGLSRGYLERPDKTAESYRPDPLGGAPGGRLYRTGDLARWLPDGSLDCLGRIDHQVKVRGFRVELGEIEAELRRHAGVREAVVVARADAAGGKSLVAYVVPSAAGLDMEELREQVARRLPQHMVPAVFVALAELPLTPNGKLDRRALPSPEEVRAEPAGRVPPRDELELALVGIWAEALGRVPGVTDDFFDLGGHSLLAVRLLSLIQERLGRTLSLASFFTEGTIEVQAAVLREALREAGDGAGAEPGGEVLVALDPGTGGRPFFCVHPVGGTAFCYFDLARGLGRRTGRPFWAFQTPAVETGGIEALAGCYVAELLEMQPEGPYSLGGWSMGGLVAFEMARLLRRSGREVDVLALIDPSPADSREAIAGLGEGDLLAWFASDLAGVAGVSLDAGVEAVRGLPADQAFDALLEWARASRLLPAGGDPALLRHLYRIFRGNLLAMGAYQPDVYAGPLHLFLAGDTDDRGWTSLAAGGVEVHRLPADHYSLLRQPCVEALAERLGSILGEAGAAVPPSNVQSQESVHR